MARLASRLGILIHGMTHFAARTGDQACRPGVGPVPAGSASTMCTTSRRGPGLPAGGCHDAHPAFASARIVTLRDALAAPRHVLWDEAAGRMVTFAEAGRARRRDRG